MKALYLSFGCKVNQVEVQSLREELAELGVRECPADAEPDICVINTCSVTATAESKLRRKVRHVARLFPNCRIFLLGCYVEKDPDLLRELPGVEAVFNNASKWHLLERLFGGRIPSHRLWFPVHSSGDHARAFVKVQDGCPENCSYCVVSKLRGKCVSRPLAEVVSELRALDASGIPEIVLTGVNLGAWGRETGAQFQTLLRASVAVLNHSRLRISSIEPQYFDAALIDACAECGPVLCRHFHIPLQSGSDRILSEMNRRYSSAEFLDIVEGIEDRMPDAALTTDIIVGYPTEDEAAFSDTLGVVFAAGFHRIHAFSYSPRPGTSAFHLGDPVTGDEKKLRIEALERVADGNLAEYVSGLKGRALEVIFDGGPEPRRNREGYSAEYLRVHSGNYPVPGSCVVRVPLYRLTDGRLIVTGPVELASPRERR
jgi:threonylcarbamoyladenosine tRNA methylthiotransferase MtaB